MTEVIMRYHGSGEDSHGLERVGELIRCGECRHNPKDAWFGCPMSHLTEKQRPDTAWCWNGERKEET